MRQLAPPESNRPTGGRGHGRIGNDDCNAFALLWVHDIWIL